MSNSETPVEPSDDPLQGAEDELADEIEKGADLTIENVEIPADYPTFESGFFEYVEAAKRQIGKVEWAGDERWWSEQMHRDWETLQERAKLEAEQAVERQMGVGQESETTYMGFDRLGSLRFIDYDQFILEANAGQFREDRFYCDKGRRWITKVREVMATYGYDYVRKVEVEGILILEVSKNPMGAIE